MVKPTPKQIKYILITAILIVILATFGNSGYKYIKKQKELLTNDITRLEYEKKVLKDSVNYYKNIDTELISTEKTYYYDYIREYNKRIKAEKALSTIKYLTFNRKYLDSLAKHVRFD